MTNNRYFPFLSQFENWYEKLHGNKKSAGSYKSYIGNLYNTVCPEIKFEYEGDIINGQLIAENLGYFLGTNDGRAFALDFLSNVASIAKKKNSDWGSAAMKYLIFISDLISNETSKKVSPTNGMPKFNVNTIKDVLNPQLRIEDEVFCNKELLEIFRARFVTQERKNGNYAHELPMRDLVKVLPGFGKWVRKYLSNNVKFIVSEYGATVILKDINHLLITTKGDVIVNLRKDKGNYPVFTKTATGKIMTFKEFNAINGSKPTIANLALDHDTSIFEILKNIGNTVPNLDKHNSGQIYNPIALFNEFKAIHDKVSFTVMDQVENVKKGK